MVLVFFYIFHLRIYFSFLSSPPLVGFLLRLPVNLFDCLFLKRSIPLAVPPVDIFEHCTGALLEHLGSFGRWCLWTVDRKAGHPQGDKGMLEADRCIKAALSRFTGLMFSAQASFSLACLPCKNQPGGFELCCACPELGGGTELFLCS